MAETLQFDALSGQIMPFSAEAEQSVLGSILIDPASMDTVGGMLRSEYFYLPQHQAVFTVLSEMYLQSNTIDLVTVLDNLKRDGVYDDAGGKAYLTQLVQMVPSSANVAEYAKIVQDKYYRRALINEARAIIADTEEGASDAGTLIDSAEQRIFNIRQGREIKGLKHIREVIHGETIYRIDRLNDPETRSDYIGIPTGFSDLDRIITGLNKSDLIILGARPGMGKTSFALNIARHVAVKEGKTLAFFSLEMNRDQLAQRFLSADACIKSEKLRTGNIEGAEWTRLVQAAEVLSKAEIYIDDTTNITVPEMKAKLRRMKKVDVVIIDYLGLMRSARQRSENRVQEISEITRGLKLMAKELNVPIIACAQLNRGTESKDNSSHRPSLSSLRDSGSIEQDADIVLFLHRENYYHRDDPENPVDDHDATCIVAKNRHGEVNDVKLYWDGQYTRFTSAGGRDE
jgi:replicative DNA helicase